MSNIIPQLQNIVIEPISNTMKSIDLLLVVNNVTGKNIELKTFHRNIRNLFINQHGTKFTPSLDSRGYVQYYNLDEVECNMIMASIDVRHLRVIATYFVERKLKPKTAIELAREQVILLEELEETKKELEHKTIQLDESMEWISIKRVAKLNAINWRDFSWRELIAHGRSVGKPPIKRHDANFGQVNTYHISSWRFVYPDLIYPATNDRDIGLLE